jgi:hypothetical protein
MVIGMMNDSARTVINCFGVLMGDECSSCVSTMDFPAANRWKGAHYSGNQCASTDAATAVAMDAIGENRYPWRAR